jgi:protein-tyrosine phosphatase
MDIVPDEVVPGLYIGAKESAANRKTLRDRNITRILVCGDALPQYHENDDSLVYLRFAIADSLAQNITEYIPYAMEFIKESLDSGQSVLVHCNAGRST